MKTELLMGCKCVFLVILSLVVASCSSVEDDQGNVAGSHKEKDKVVLYRGDSDSVSVSPHSHSLVLQHQW
jgi:hypothetical protein